MKIGIYKITAPDGRIYIGQSCNLERRYNEHKSHNAKLSPKLYKSYMKYGFINHRFEILVSYQTYDAKLLNISEQYYIDYYRNIGSEMLNSINATRWRDNEEHEHKTKIYPKSLEHKEKISKSLTGIIHSPEHCKKNGLAKKGQYPASAKRVIDLDTNIIYPSARIAAEEFGYKHSTLKAMLNGQRINKTNLRYEYRDNNCSDK